MSRIRQKRQAILRSKKDGIGLKSEIQPIEQQEEEEIKLGETVQRNKPLLTKYFSQLQFKRETTDLGLALTQRLSLRDRSKNLFSKL